MDDERFCCSAKNCGRCVVYIFNTWTYSGFLVNNELNIEYTDSGVSNNSSSANNFSRSSRSCSNLLATEVLFRSFNVEIWCLYVVLITAFNNGWCQRINLSFFNICWMFVVRGLIARSSIAFSYERDLAAFSVIKYFKPSAKGVVTATVISFLSFLSFRRLIRCISDANSFSLPEEYSEEDSFFFFRLRRKEASGALPTFSGEVSVLLAPEPGLGFLNRPACSSSYMFGAVVSIHTPKCVRNIKNCAKHSHRRKTCKNM